MGPSATRNSAIVWGRLDSVTRKSIQSLLSLTTTVTVRSAYTSSSGRWVGTRSWLVRWLDMLTATSRVKKWPRQNIQGTSSWSQVKVHYFSMNCDSVVPGQTYLTNQRPPLQQSTNQKLFPCHITSDQTEPKPGTFLLGWHLYWTLCYYWPGWGGRVAALQRVQREQPRVLSWANIIFTPPLITTWSLQTLLQTIPITLMGAQTCNALLNTSFIIS